MRSQSTVEIKLLPVSENGRPPYWHYISCFHFDLCVIIGMWFCISLPNFVLNRLWETELWRHIDFSRWRQYGRKATLSSALVSEFVLRSWKSICDSHSWDKTTSGLGKRTVAILEFYFRFRFWPMFSSPHLILLQPAKFRRNHTIRGGVMTSCRIFKMAAMSHTSTSGFRFIDGTCLRRWITICIPHFDEISQCTAEIKLLPVSENGRPPY